MAYSQEFRKRERQVFQEDGHGEGDEHCEKSHSKREGEEKRRERESWLREWQCLQLRRQSGPAEK